MMIISTLTLLFQVICAQDFTINIAPVTVAPVNVTVNARSILYDEVGQFVYIAGLTYSGFDSQTFVDGTDVFLTKHSLNGTRIWTRIVGGSYNDLAYKVLQNSFTSDLIICGSSTSSIDGQTNAGGFADSFLVSYSQNGTKLFSRLFGTAGDDGAFDMLIAYETQQLIIAGKVTSKVALTTHDIRNGSLLQAYLFSADGSALGAVSASTRPDIFITGYVTSSLDQLPLYGGDDVFLAKMNYFNGTRYWSKVWGNTFQNRGLDVQFDAQSKLVFVAGYTYNGSINGQIELGGWDSLLFCTSENGTLLWTRQFGSVLDDYAFALAISQTTGTLFVVGSSSFIGSSSSMGFVWTFAQNGAMLQQKFVNGTSNFREISLSSSGTTAYIADRLGLFVSLNISSSGTLSVSAGTTTPFTSATPSTSTAVIAFSWQSTKDSFSSIAMTTSLETSLPNLTANINPTETEAETPGPSTLDFNPPTDTPSPDTDFVQVVLQSLSLRVLLFIAIAVAVLLICVCSCATLLYARRKTKSRSLETSAVELPTKLIGVDAHTLTASDSTMTETEFRTTTQITQTKTETTLIRTGFELALPGFLCFEMLGNFKAVQQLAVGGGGTVYLGEAKAPELVVYGGKLAIKIVGHDHTLSIDKLSESVRSLFRQEVSIMHFFREEKHIAKLLGYCERPVALLLKFYELGSLAEWLTGTSKKSKRNQMQFMLDISKGLLAMHNAGFVHCDLKPQNVLLDRDEDDQIFCVLTDFGITQVVDDTSLLVRDFTVVDIRGFSIRYAAPEAFETVRSMVQFGTRSGEVVMKMDVYSAGVMFQELLTRQMPWSRK